MDYDLDEIKMIFAPCALIICMVWDILVEVAKDYVKISSWVPNNLFVLSALTVEILGYIDIQKVNVLDPASSEDFEELVDDQLKMDAARLTMCIFLGCLLPGMAMAGTRGSWSNIAALFISLSFHIGTEIYAMQNLNTSKVGREADLWFVSSGVLLLIGSLSMLVLLGAVILSGKLAHDGVSSDIAEMLGKDVENEGDKRGLLTSEVMESWVAVRAWKTLYFLASSAFSPGAAIIVTTCVAFMAAKVKCRSSLLHHNFGGGNLTFYLQCVFILVGWILMLGRWIKTGLACATSLEKGRFIKILSFFLHPAAVVVNPLCPTLSYFLLNPKELSMKNISISFPRPLQGLLLWNILMCLPCVVLLLPLCVLSLTICLLGFYCFVFWYFSALLFGSKLIRTLWKIHSVSDSENGEYSKYQSVLKPIYSNKEKIDTFWVVNKKSFNRIKRSMDGVDKVEQNCPRLFSIMGTRKLAENQRLRPIEKGWMETISSIFSAIADIEIGVDMKDAFKAYKETEDVLKFVDCPDNIVVDPLSIFGTLNVIAFAASINWGGKICKLEKNLMVTIEERTTVGVITSEERERVDKMLKELSCELERYDERVPNCLLIRLGECSYYNMEELGDMLRSLVGHVIVSALLEAQDVLLKYTKQWVRNIDESKIKRAIELGVKVSALLENLVEDGDILFGNL